MTFEDLEQYRAKLIAIVHKIVRDEHLAEDIAQETMMAAIAALPKQKTTIVHLEAWLIAVAKKTAAMVIRSKVRRQKHEKKRVGPKAKIGKFGHSDNLDATRVVLAAIKPRHRQIIVWRYFDDRSDGWIAASLGLSLVRVRVRLALARQAFHAKWKELHPE